MDDISQRTKTAGWKFGSSRATKKRRGRGRGAVTDSANDSSRSGPKFWKHSALPDGIRRSGRVSQYFLPVQNNAFHSLSKTYGVVLCSTWKRMINLEKLCLHLFWSRSVSVSIIREREIVGKRCIRRRRGEKNGMVNCSFRGIGSKAPICCLLVTLFGYLLWNLGIDGLPSWKEKRLKREKKSPFFIIFTNVKQWYLWYNNSCCQHEEYLK